MNNYFNYKISIGEALLYFFAIMIVAQVVMGLISMPALAQPSLSNFLLPLSFFGGFGAAALTIMILKKLDFSQLRHFFHFKIKVIYIVLAILLYFVSLPMAEYLSMLVPPDANAFLEELYRLMEDSFQMVFDYPIAAFIMVCILAPILEELIFRGLLLRGMLQQGVNPWFSIIFTALLFGIAHMNPWQFFGAGFLGAIFGFIYWRTQSLWLVIFLHFLNNFIAYIITMQTNSLDETVFEPDFLILGGSALLTIVILYYFYQQSASTTLHEVEETEQFPPYQQHDQL